MLKIAVIANTFQEGQRFIEFKFKNRIEKISHTKGIYYLPNGDEIHICYDYNNDPAKYKGMVYDAFIVHPTYQSLLDVIKERTVRYA